MYKCEQCNEKHGHERQPCRHGGAEIATPMYRRELQQAGDVTAEGYPPILHCPCCGADQDPKTEEWFYPYQNLSLDTWPREDHVWENEKWHPYPETLIWRGTLRAYLAQHKGAFSDRYTCFSGRGLRNVSTEAVIQPPRSFGALEGDDAFLWGIIHSFFENTDGPAPCIFGLLTSHYVSRQCGEIGIPPI